MAKMRVLRDKPLRYPVSGPEGKEYKRGEEFIIPPGPYEARDVEHFTKIRVAELVEEKAQAKPARKDMTAEQSEPPPAAPTSDEPTRAYRRRDMRVEE